MLETHVSHEDDQAAAQDNEMFRQAVEIESFDVGLGLRRRKARTLQARTI